MVYYGLLWFTMVYYGLLWFTMVYYGLLWFTMVYYVYSQIGNGLIEHFGF